VHLVQGDQSRAQRHLFFAEREAAKVPGIGKEVTPRPVKRAGVIGAGTMGGGIAMALANGGIPVTILEMTDEALKRGLGVIEKNYSTSVSRGSLTEEKKAERFGRLKGTTDYADLADCDLIIEAVFEEMAVKRRCSASSTRSPRRAPSSPPTPPISTSTRSPPRPRDRPTCWACTSSRRPM
jgi:3-hydroxyacyl-CoA dehydrogenase